MANLAYHEKKHRHEITREIGELEELLKRVPEQSRDPDDQAARSIFERLLENRRRMLKGA